MVGSSLAGAIKATHCPQKNPAFAASSDKSSTSDESGHPTCRVLQVKSDCSSPQTLSAATTSTITRNMKSTESQTLPRPVEWRFAPTNWLYRAGQDILQKQTGSCVGVSWWATQTWTQKDVGSRGWRQRRATERTKFERGGGWKGMKLRGGGEKAVCQHSCEPMNLCAHCGLYWPEPTQLKTHYRTLSQNI